MPLRNNPSTRTIPELANLGVPHVVAAAELGVGVQATKSFALAGASPHALLVADLVSQNDAPLLALADALYTVTVNGNSAAKLDLTTRTTAGFSLVGGSDTDVVSLVIHGRFGQMKV